MVKDGSQMEGESFGRWGEVGELLPLHFLGTERNITRIKIWFASLPTQLYLSAPRNEQPKGETGNSWLVFLPLRLITFIFYVAGVL